MTEGSNPRYPPTKEAVKCGSERVSSNPEYPPITDAVKGNTQGAVAEGGTDSSSVTEGSNPRYPPTKEAVKSGSACVSSNPEYPAVSDAVKGANPGSVTSNNNLSYPLPLQAATSRTGGVRSNPRYPTISEAMRLGLSCDETNSELTGGEKPSLEIQRNASCLPVVKAVKSRVDDESDSSTLTEEVAVTANTRSRDMSDFPLGIEEETRPGNSKDGSETKRDDSKGCPSFFEDDSNSLF